MERKTIADASWMTLDDVKRYYEWAYEKVNGKRPYISFTTNGWFELGFGGKFRKTRIIEMANTLLDRLENNGHK